ncbi:MAG: orotidine-5'-phosphate decarboxylase [Candidatus Zixiibacteriota bacterium]|nr:MAG: orotidine-5'-phosphate decarboxylase [candidate division Zixibacteria bacterium]
MSALKDLQAIQQENKSIICLGLDLDRKRMPSEYAGSTKGMFEFAHRIIDATSDLVCAYKPNLAFYEALGSEGLSLLRLICQRIPRQIPIILDGKRGDIGNTSTHYAQFLFEYLGGRWVTLNPYMGYDSLRPFLEYKDCGVFILCLTSNSGSKDFQLLRVDGKPLYQVVAEKVAYWDKEHNCGLVVGATHADQLRDLREIAGDMPLLIPGVGAQGGSLERAAVNGTYGFKKTAVINVSRSVLYASAEKDFAQRARQELEKLNGIINDLRMGKTEDRSSADAEGSATAAANPPASQSLNSNRNKE